MSQNHELKCCLQAMEQMSNFEMVAVIFFLLFIFYLVHNDAPRLFNEWLFDYFIVSYTRYKHGKGLEGLISVQCNMGKIYGMD